MTSFCDSISKWFKVSANLAMFACVCTLTLACKTQNIEHVEPQEKLALLESNNSQQLSTSTNVNQISKMDSSTNADQINQTTSVPQLTVEQLMTYADRCGPNRSLDQDIDCSDLSLKMKRIFKTEDRVTDALITLNRLGRSNSIAEVDDEFNRTKRGQLSPSAQAVAGGVITGTPSRPSIEEQPILTDEVEQFLNGIGLGVNAGAIVVQPNGG